MSHMALQLVYFSSFSSLWDLTSSFIFFLCSLACFLCFPVLPSSVSLRSEKEVKLQCLFDGEICSVSLPFFWLSLNTFSLSGSLFFFLGWDAREFVWVFFCLIVGFCESWDHQTLTESCSPVQLCFITYTRSYWNPIPLEVHSSFPLHLGAFFVTQTRAFV